MDEVDVFAAHGVELLHLLLQRQRLLLPSQKRLIK
jgi:hypothetical protein